MIGDRTVGWRTMKPRYCSAYAATTIKGVAA